MLGVNPTSALSTSRAKNLGKPSCLEEEAWVALKHVAPGVTFWGGGTNVSSSPVVTFGLHCIPKKSDGHLFGFCFLHHICFFSLTCGQQGCRDSINHMPEPTLLTMVIYKKSHFLCTMSPISPHSVFACTKMLEITIRGPNLLMSEFFCLCKLAIVLHSNKSILYYT